LFQRRDAKLYFFGFFLFLLNLLAGLLLINEGMFHFDSVILAQAVEKTYQTGQLQSAVYGRYGAVIVNSFLYFPFFLGKESAEFATLFSSVLFHSLSIVAFFLLIYELFGNRVQAVFGALLLSFTPFYFSPNTYGKEHGMCMFFFLLSLFLLHRGRRSGSLWLIGLSSLFCGFSASVREAILPAIPLYFLLYFIADTGRGPHKSHLPSERSDQKMLLFMALPVSIILVSLVLTYLSPVISTALFRRSTAIANFEGLFSPTLKTALMDILWIVPKVLFVFFFAGIYLLKRDKRSPLLLFLVLWTMQILIFGNVSNYKPRFLDIVIAPFFIIVSYALAWLYIRSRIVAMALVAYCVVTMFLFMFPMLYFRHHYCGEKQLALYVRAVTEKDAVIITTDEFPFIEYYGHRNILVMPHGGSRIMGDFAAKVNGFLKSDIPVYYTDNPYYVYIESGARRWLMKYYRLDNVGGALNEDFHIAELASRRVFQNIFRVHLKETARSVEPLVVRSH
jgi:hypothetical protein